MVFRNINLKALFALLSALALLSCAAGGYLYYTAVRDASLERDRKEAADMVALVGKEIDTEMSWYLVAAKGMSGLHAFRESLEHKTAGAPEETNAVLDHYNTQLKADVCYLMDTSGRVIATTNRNSPSSFLEKTYAFRPYFSQAVKGHPAIFMALGVTSGRRGIYYSAPVWDHRRTAIKGVTVIKTSLDRIDQSLSTYDRGIMLLVSPEGVIFAASRNEIKYRLLWQPAPGEIKRIEASRKFGKGPWEWSGMTMDSEGRVADREGRQYLLLGYHLNHSPGWQIVLLHDQQRLLTRIVTPLRNTVGMVVAALCLALGISVFFLYRRASTSIARRKTAEKVLRESEERFRGIVDAMADWIWEVDETGTYTYCSGRVETVLGYKPQEVVGKTPFDLMLPDQAARAREIFRSAMENQDTIRDFENWNLHRNGTRVCLLTSGVPIIDETGAFRGYRGVDSDITHRKQMEERIREESENFKKVFYNDFSAVAIIDRDRFVDCSQGFADLLDAGTREEVLHIHPSRISPEVQPDGSPSGALADKMIAEALDRGFHSFEWVHKTLGGKEFPVDVSLTRIKWEGRPVLHCHWKDLSREKAIIENVNRAKDAAEEAARAKSDFLANMSHEIRTPMNGIIGMIEMLLETDLTPEQKDYAHSVSTSADALLTLLNDILDFSKIEAGKLVLEHIEFNLRPSLENLCDTIAVRAHQKGVEVACLIHESVPCRLVGDPGRIRQILTNLMGNAVKFVEAGHIYLTVEVEEQDARQATLRFTVADTGIGIPPHRIDTLFDAFTQADASMTRKYGGTGLGLSISRQLAELMGGSIGAESRPGEGSTFWFTVALGKQSLAVVPRVIVPENPKGKHVLVVDDHSLNRKIFKEYLKSWNCRFKEAASGQEGLKKLLEAARRGRPFDIAILDMQMPEMTGETLGKTIKGNPAIAGTELVMATSLGLRGEAARMAEAGFSAYVTKPVKKGPLFDCLRIVLGRKNSGTRHHIVTRHTINDAMANKGENDPEKEMPAWHILLAEDNPMNQKVAANMLQKMGHRVTLADNGEEALRLYRENRFDLILMDGQMPVMDGISATRAIRDSEKRNEKPPIPIIAVTANAMKGDRERFISAGMSDYISKPIKRDKLQAALQKAMAERPA